MLWLRETHDYLCFPEYRQGFTGVLRRDAGSFGPAPGFVDKALINYNGRLAQAELSTETQN
jgi:hypothetical protein